MLGTDRLTSIIDDVSITHITGDETAESADAFISVYARGAPNVRARQTQRLGCLSNRVPGTWRGSPSRPLQRRALRYDRPIDLHAAHALCARDLPIHVASNR